jgi:hypothetical protein
MAHQPAAVKVKRKQSWGFPAAFNLHTSGGVEGNAASWQRERRQQQIRTGSRLTMEPVLNHGRKSGTWISRSLTRNQARAACVRGMRRLMRGKYLEDRRRNSTLGHAPRDPAEVGGQHQGD